MDKVALVTGGSGFLGRRVVKTLLDKNYKVISIVRGDTKQDLERYFKENNISFVIHTATCYGREKDSFFDVVRANLALPLDLLELSLVNGVQAFINADTFFNSSLGLRPKEKSYITTKKLFLELALEAVKNSNLKFVNMKIQHMYGPGDSEAKSLSAILNNILANKPSIDLTKGEQKRDFVYVGDVAEAFVKAVECYESLGNVEEFEIGTGEPISIKDAVSEMQKLSKSETVLNWGVLPYRENEIMNVTVDLSNNSKINWKAQHSFFEGIDLTIKSLKNNP